MSVLQRITSSQNCWSRTAWPVRQLAESIVVNAHLSYLHEVAPLRNPHGIRHDGLSRVPLALDICRFTRHEYLV
jgi:hypothetical protein